MGFPQSWGYPNSWMVYFMENPTRNGWFGGNPISGNHHISETHRYTFTMPPSTADSKLQSSRVPKNHWKGTCIMFGWEKVECSTRSLSVVTNGDSSLLGLSKTDIWFYNLSFINHLLHVNLCESRFPGYRMRPSKKVNSIDTPPWWFHRASYGSHGP